MKKRILHYGFLLAVLIVVNFFLPRMLPGSPLKSLAGGDPGELTAAQKMGILETYHFNDPLPKQFAYYLKDLFTLNWGVSYSKRQPIPALIKSRAGWTLLLAGSSMILSTFLGTALGAWSALKRKKGKDLPVIMITTVVSSVPSFWIAVILLAVFGVRLGWFPMYGAYSMWETYSGMDRIFDIGKHLFLPLVTMTTASLMGFFTTSRQQRASDYRGRLYQAGENERNFEKTSCNGLYYEKYDGSGIYAVYDGCRIFAGRFGTG